MGLEHSSPRGKAKETTKAKGHFNLEKTGGILSMSINM